MDKLQQALQSLEFQSVSFMANQMPNPQIFMLIIELPMPGAN